MKLFFQYSYHCSTLKFFFDSLYLFRMEVMLKKKKKNQTELWDCVNLTVMKFILAFKLKSSFDSCSMSDFNHMILFKHALHLY